MYEYISGKLHIKQYNYVVVDVGGIGYKLLTTGTSAAQVAEGDEVTFYTYLHVREDILDLYGFATIEERRTFEMLLTISGVGPKAALSILSSLTSTELALAVVNGDSKAITKANGVGVKMAQRICLELKDKVSGEKTQDVAPLSNTMGDAESALLVLGYSSQEARKAIKNVQGETVEDIIKQALQFLMK